MPKIHLICKDRNLIWASCHPEYKSGNWDLTENEASTLVGGLILFHQSKKQVSYFGGIITSYEVLYDDKKKIVFTLTSVHEAKNVTWEGNLHHRSRKSLIV